MAFCGKCGQQVNDGIKFCPACGAPMATTIPEPEAQPQSTVNDAFTRLNNTADNTAQFDPKDIEQNKVMALLSYLGILVLVPIFAAKESLFARFHANQGVVLCIALFGWIIVDSILSAILRAILWRGLGLWGLYVTVGTVLDLVYIAFTILAIIGIINTLNGRAKELPVIGKYKILK